jgi:hypothetical protein
MVYRGVEGVLDGVDSENVPPIEVPWHRIVGEGERRLAFVMANRFIMGTAGLRKGVTGGIITYFEKGTSRSKKKIGRKGGTRIKAMGCEERQDPSHLQLSQNLYRPRLMT